MEVQVVEMSKLLNKPAPQPWVPLETKLVRAQKMHADALAVVKRGVAGKYQAQRLAQVEAYSHVVAVLQALAGGEEAA